MHALERQIDAVDTSNLTSGKADARAHRKSLNAEVDNLIKRTQELHNDFASTAEKISQYEKNNAGASPSTASTKLKNKKKKINIISENADSNNQNVVPETIIEAVVMDNDTAVSAAADNERVKNKKKFNKEKKAVKANKLPLGKLL
jgi:hypothetical protein